MLEKVIYRRMEDQYLPALQMLFAEIFNRRVSLQYLKAKYDTSYLGFKYACCMAFDHEKPVAFYGAIPQKFSKKGNSFIVAHACDSLTLSIYRKMGLHYQLALRTYEIMKSEGFKFVYAFHSENTYHSTKKLGWKEHLRMSRFHLKVNTIPFAKILPKFHLEKRYKAFVSKILKHYSVDPFPLRPDIRSTDGQVYDHSFIEYKDAFNSHFGIQLNECFIWLKVESIIKIGLFTAPSLDKFQLAISELKKLARRIGVNEILFQVSSNTEQYRFLKRIADPHESWLVGYLLFDTEMSNGLHDFEFNYCDLDTF